MSEENELKLNMAHRAKFCDQTARDGIWPGLSWFKETAADLRAAEAEIARLEQCHEQVVSGLNQAREGWKAAEQRVQALEEELAQAKALAEAHRQDSELCVGGNKAIDGQCGADECECHPPMRPPFTPASGEER